MRYIGPVLNIRCS